MKLCQRIKVSGNSAAVIKRLISQIRIFRSFVQCLTMTPQFFSGIQSNTNKYKSLWGWRLQNPADHFFWSNCWTQGCIWKTPPISLKLLDEQQHPKCKHFNLSHGFFVESFTFTSPADVQIPTVTHKGLCHEKLLGRGVASLCSRQELGLFTCGSKRLHHTYIFVFLGWLLRGPCLGLRKVG